MWKGSAAAKYRMNKPLKRLIREKDEKSGRREKRPKKLGRREKNRENIGRKEI